MPDGSTNKDRAFVRVATPIHLELEQFDGSEEEERLCCDYDP